MYDIQGTVMSEPTMDQVLAALRLRGAIIVKNSAAHVEFRSELIQFNWNLLAPISSGVIRIGTGKVEYFLNLFRCRAMCLLLSTCILVSMPFVPNGTVRIMLLLWFAVVWGVLYGVNRSVTSTRFRLLIKDIETVERRDE